MKKKIEPCVAFRDVDTIWRSYFNICLIIEKKIESDCEYQNRRTPCPKN